MGLNVSCLTDVYDRAEDVKGREGVREVDAQVRSPVFRLLEERERERKLRYDLFDRNEVNDPCWAILQELYHGLILLRPVTNGQLADAAGLPFSTLARYLDHLLAIDLIEIPGHAADDCPQLSRAGKARMEEYLCAVIILRRVNGSV